jgi:hypothetical protein
MCLAERSRIYNGFDSVILSLFLPTAELGLILPSSGVAWREAVHACCFLSLTRVWLSSCSRSLQLLAAVRLHVSLRCLKLARQARARFLKAFAGNTTGGSVPKTVDRSIITPFLQGTQRGCRTGKWFDRSICISLFDCQRIGCQGRRNNLIERFFFMEPTHALLSPLIHFPHPMVHCRHPLVATSMHSSVEPKPAWTRTSPGM